MKNDLITKLNEQSEGNVEIKEYRNEKELYIIRVFDYYTLNRKILEQFLYSYEGDQLQYIVYEIDNNEKRIILSIENGKEYYEIYNIPFSIYSDYSMTEKISDVIIYKAKNGNEKTYDYTDYKNNKKYKKVTYKTLNDLIYDKEINIIGVKNKMEYILDLIKNTKDIEVAFKNNVYIFTMSFDDGNIELKLNRPNIDDYLVSIDKFDKTLTATRLDYKNTVSLLIKLFEKKFNIHYKNKSISNELSFVLSKKNNLEICLKEKDLESYEDALMEAYNFIKSLNDCDVNMVFDSYIIKSFKNAATETTFLDLIQISIDLIKLRNKIINLDNNNSLVKSDSKELVKQANPFTKTLTENIKNYLNEHKQSLKNKKENRTICKTFHNPNDNGYKKIKTINGIKVYTETYKELKYSNVLIKEYFENNALYMVEKEIENKDKIYYETVMFDEKGLLSKNKKTISKINNKCIYEEEELRSR